MLDTESPVDAVDRNELHNRSLIRGLVVLGSELDSLRK